MARRMTEADMQRILARAAAYDNRRPDRITLEAWLAAIGDLNPDDALDAVVEHYAHSTEWLKPAHLRALVKRKRAERLRGADRQLPPADPDASDYSAQLRQALRDIADGRTVTRALTTGPGRGTAPPETYTAARGPGYTLRRAALSIPCPIPGCRADTGRPCRTPGTRRPLPAGYHPARLDTARSAPDHTEEAG